jgi:curved DNA-binding protein CbpA
LLDYYKILAVSQDATNDQIRKAYRVRAKLYHPDLNKNDNAKLKFQIVYEAYQTLIDPKKRKWYDFKMKFGDDAVISKGQTPRQRDAQRTAKRYQYYASKNANYAKNNKEREEQKYIKSVVDKVLFYILMLFGSLACIFGTIHLIYDKWEGFGDLKGVLFGVSFVFLLVYGWRTMDKP